MIMSFAWFFHSKEINLHKWHITFVIIKWNYFILKLHIQQKKTYICMKFIEIGISKWNKKQIHVPSSFINSNK